MLNKIFETVSQAQCNNSKILVKQNTKLEVSKKNIGRSTKLYF